MTDYNRPIRTTEERDRDDARQDGALVTLARTRATYQLASTDPAVADPHSAAHWGALAVRHLGQMAEAIINDVDTEDEHADAATICARIAAECAGFGPVDILSTGELQPRLPAEVGAVRTIEARAGAVADLPFTLSAPVADGTDAAQPSLLPSGLPEVAR